MTWFKRLKTKIQLYIKWKIFCKELKDYEDKVALDKKQDEEIMEHYRRYKKLLEEQ